ncbi:MAG: RpiB/LacA/LacB family sugar-phosphate isomerase [Tannerella sp.]|jgi:ribose 5-phosphate isomerase B|nr:RpiB/LacA/LacB family sugar-phosphate isomerase [Tannerella sp.]
MNFETSTIGLASDHTGFGLKEVIKKYLEKRGLKYTDFGACSTERSDYTDFAHLLGKAIESHELEAGIALCGTGNGMAITLNKYPSIRAGLAWSAEISGLVSGHNKANILIIPARYVTEEEALKIVEAYLDTPFEGGRHLTRIEKILSA